MGNNPYSDPYIPEFASQRPRIQTTPQPTTGYKPIIYGQIYPVSGFEGAKAFATERLAPGYMMMVAEDSPDLARMYIIAKDQSSAVCVKGFDLIPVEEPRQVTMTDLSVQLADIQSRLTKLEESNVNDKPVWNANTTVKPAKNTSTDGGKQPKLPSSDETN